MTYAVQDLAALVGGVVEGDGTQQISGLSGLEDAQPGQLSFFGNPRYKQQYLATKASAVLIDEAAVARAGVAIIRVKQPHLAFAKVAQAFFHLHQLGKKFDVILADPPYAPGAARIIQNLYKEYPLLTPRGILAIEHGEKDADLAPDITGELVRQRKYGETLLTLFRVP